MQRRRTTPPAGRYLDLAGIPAPVARGLKLLVDTLRRDSRPHVPPRRTPHLPVWTGAVTGSLRRADLYDEGD